ncbi:pseudaminic acid cytidylyltransferase [Deltaproteobacteria bacterium OttesenSCG-928-K17]|nr:pseudaminic acid cytidylyltransferase [Deltaproteobacteria bacterium OttesenSCG-928-K17]
MNIAVITARGGSKRIPGKNIKPFAGKPMLGWPIEAALSSGLFGRVIVSTDSDEVAEAAIACGAEVPFRRPPELSDDLTPTAPVLLHALKWAQAENLNPEYLCCIYPTAPFVRPEDLARGLETVRSSGAPGAVSVTTFDFPILRAFKLAEDGAVSWSWPEYEMTRSQDLPEFYHDAGQFYWLKADEFLKIGRLIMPGTRPVVLPRARVQDIDTPEDWEAAELMAKVLLAGRTV